MDAKERQLRQYIVQQQLKAKEVVEELNKARQQLNNLSVHGSKTNKENMCYGN